MYIDVNTHQHCHKPKENFYHVIGIRPGKEMLLLYLFYFEPLKESLMIIGRLEKNILKLSFLYMTIREEKHMLTALKYPFLQNHAQINSHQILAIIKMFHSAS